MGLSEKIRNAASCTRCGEPVEVAPGQPHECSRWYLDSAAQDAWLAKYRVSPFVRRALEGKLPVKEISR
jgi:hypothetical protein